MVQIQAICRFATASVETMTEQTTVVPSDYERADVSNSTSVVASTTQFASATETVLGANAARS